MKCITSASNSRPGFTLYPTTFRWNSLLGLVGANWGHLYIPLRSDEMTTRCGLTTISWAFISHYVQMKSGISLQLPAPGPALYPTTFRWNVAKRIAGVLGFDLYIPLRSDEMLQREIVAGPDEIFISHYVQMKWSRARWRRSTTWTLYPTTFRWNFWAAGYAALFAGFISHYVQMKFVAALQAAWGWIALYPTTFRWNPLFLRLINPI